MEDNFSYAQGSNPKATSIKVQTNWVVKAAMYRRLSGCSGRLGSLVQIHQVSIRIEYCLFLRAHFAKSSNRTTSKPRRPPSSQSTRAELLVALIVALPLLSTTTVLVDSIQFVDTTTQPPLDKFSTIKLRNIFCTSRVPLALCISVSHFSELSSQAISLASRRVSMLCSHRPQYYHSIISRTLLSLRQ